MKQCSRRRWIDEQRFLDLVGATNLIPGPNATEMAIHLGLIRAGWRGHIAAGATIYLAGDGGHDACRLGVRNLRFDT